jgi:hypothetical protein
MSWRRSNDERTLAWLRNTRDKSVHSVASFVPNAAVPFREGQGAGGDASDE